MQLKFSFSSVFKKKMQQAIPSFSQTKYGNECTDEQSGAKC